MADDQPVAVPLIERLRSVPLDAVLRIDTPNALGCMDTRSIPVGRLCHEAADALGVPEAEAPPCPVCGGTERSRAGYLLCECPAASLKPGDGVKGTPPTYKLVPLEPTEEMAYRGGEATAGRIEWDDAPDDAPDELARAIYRAMLKAAPDAGVGGNSE